MKRPPRIEDVEEPVIGELYNVPSIIVKLQTDACRRLWFPKVTPIIGPMHEDAEFIGFPKQHWHVDWRFVPPKYWQRLTPNCLYPEVAALEQIAASKVVTQAIAGEMLRAVRRCYRPAAVFSHERLSWLRELEQAYHQATARCGICPHRGIPLAGAPVVEGARVCPGHGLHWRISDGSLVMKSDTAGHA